MKDLLERGHMLFVSIQKVSFHVMGSFVIVTLVSGQARLNNANIIVDNGWYYLWLMSLYNEYVYKHGMFTYSRWK